MSNTALLSQMYATLDELELLSGVSSLLDWDQSVMMPPAGVETRARQRGLLATLLHERQSNPVFLEVVDTLAARITELDDDDAVNVRELKRSCDRERKLPASFVERQALLASQTYAVWKEAKPGSDFASVQPLLEQIVALSREEAEIVGYKDDPYDCLLDKYEPGARIAEVQPLLTRLATSLTEILPQIQAKQSIPPALKGAALDRQELLCRRVAEGIGFSFASGRLDPTVHPFASTLGAGDFRITARYRSDDYLPALYVTLHEAGHALYEMGLDPTHRGRPLGDAVSLSIHESQSLLWEDVIGRDYPFLEYAQGVMQEILLESERYADNSFWQRVNYVEPSLIRVDADEVTYSLHIVIRMELELALLRGELAVADLPDAWAQGYQRYLGIEVPDHRHGILQDVHWYHGSIGYFPTYALGKLYAAMFYRQLRQDLPDLDRQIRSGQFQELLGWLRSNIHRHGMRYQSKELVARVCGSQPYEQAFLAYLQTKYL